MSVILGSLWGDEGKGLTTSFLCSKLENPLVIRFNGGHQAGHTIEQDGIRHVFSNFGSGTLQNIPTYWSKYCTFYPIGVSNELKALRRHNYQPKLFVNPLCPVTTPYDVEINRSIEITNQHGSCGVGFGSTIQRQESYYKLYVQDLFFEDVLIAKLSNIEKYYNFSISQFSMDNFLEKCREVRDFIQVKTYDDIVRETKGKFQPVCEGAQGLLLDMDFGFFPNVTRSNTTCRNAFDIAGTQDVYYAVRTYQTRHGNGFMTNEELPFPTLINNEKETNQFNDWQGEFRKSILDLDLLNYAYKCDSNFSTTVAKKLMITCVDQTGENIVVTKNKKVMEINFADIPNYLDIKFKAVYASFGPSIKDIVKIR